MYIFDNQRLKMTRLLCLSEDHQHLSSSISSHRFVSVVPNIIVQSPPIGSSVVSVGACLWKVKNKSIISVRAFHFF
ncbi:hypothetical protein HanXRQr2_Chr03g0132371 [Helianthus annuus]|uniref:Uncharacterized protein n=1 Tax=Helianthus annuus TaxID=4232 RepID=A0A9K3NXM7_HELAN|nr:hypothetical protein HanXRQr2_Chr03g0132371 [Helianthus annuus]